ncbi:MAG: DUF4928 family protein [Chloroflexi bacterium]|nr:DUF4928 family protein [Chloroflexota bacterium]
MWQKNRIEQRISIEFDPDLRASRFFEDVLDIASKQGKGNPVARHLVGAMLEMRFPQLTIENRPFSSANEQLGFAGDFRIGEAVFHVTVSPMSWIYQKCKRNLDDGLIVFLLVPEAATAGATQNADAVAPGQISVLSIESFLGQNIYEMAEFVEKEVRTEIRRLLETYNKRVSEVENDKSMLIDIPPNLLD